MEETYSLTQKAITWLLTYGPNIVLAVAMLFGGLWLIRRLTGTMNLVLRNRKVDESLRPFFVSVAEVGMKVMLLLIVAGRLGFETTSFIAVISALAFAVGLALQGSLGNFASGVLILLFRPYKVGDLITVGELTGTVREIQIFNTLLETPSGKRIILPNGSVTSGPIQNVPSYVETRVEAIIQVDEDTSVNMVRAVLTEVSARNPLIISSKPVHVAVLSFPGGGLELCLGVWASGENHDAVFFFLNEEIKKSFDAVGIKLAKDDPKIILAKG